ncbi:MAG: hypothetical protein IIB17_00135 [Chloroflexi bacterium]|nr:hypothetical protein [Chloroflexota bacterium]
MGLSDNQEQFLTYAQILAREIGDSGKELTSIIGELWVCKLQDMTWKPTTGFDAVNQNKHKVQIKTRKSWSTSGVNPSGRVGRFGRKNKYLFDIGIYVELDSDFNPYKIWSLTPTSLEKLESKEKNGRGLHISTVRNSGTVIWTQEKT